jgi:hypothetical protein
VVTVASGAHREQRRRKRWGTGRGALVAALGRKRRGEARVFPRIRSGLAKRRRRFGVGCWVTFAGRSHASSMREEEDNQKN